jgi:1-acyl-sn-glycerol-3-phosphate acyltransferase
LSSAPQPTDSAPAAGPDSPDPASGDAGRVLAVVAALGREVQAGRPAGWTPALDSSLEREVGLDSLGRAELLQRLERACGVRLPESAFTAETPRDLLAAVRAARTSLADGSGYPGHPSHFSQPGRPALDDGLAPAAPAGQAEAAPERTRTLLEVLAWHVDRHPERRHLTYEPGEGPAEPLSYGELDRRGRAVAAGLRGLGLAPGQTVGIMLPTGLDYFAAFVGIQLAGGIPVPLYPPARRSQIEDHLRRQAGILATAEAVALITFDVVRPLARLLSAQLPGMRGRTVAELSAAGPAAHAPLPSVKGDDVAFLQFTSGSTGSPKGVILTHANLLANLRAIGRGAAIAPDDGVVSWLPLYHDMGLIGTWMASLYFSMPLALLSPLTFLSRPSRWLWALHRHQATLSAAPNFAYELCVAKIADEEIAGLDLSRWRAALNGAEPVSPETMARFSARFAPYGFRPEAMMPVYGLAECSLAVAFPPPGRGPRIDPVTRAAFEREGRAAPAAPDDPTALRFVSCGPPLAGHEVRIVDPSGREVGEREQGRLEFRGPSATAGYFRNPEATAQLIRGDWRDSGDLAYVAAGEVYITGRAKDLIVRAGRNIYPQEVEQAVGEVPGIRRGCVAVFGSPDPQAGTERLVVVAEVRDRDLDATGRERLSEAIRARTLDLLGEPADEVVLVPPHTVPKTSSGKIRRSASRELFERGKLDRGAASGAARSSAVWWQMARLASDGVAPQLRRARRAAALRLYGAWFYALVAAAIVPVWLTLAVLPGRRRRRTFARGVARGLARLTGIPLTVDGLDRLPEGPALIAANHASYLDGFVLTAALPPRFAYVVKSELERSLVPRVLLRALGAVFVERFEPGRGTAEAGKALAALRAGDPLVIFPEGTFVRAPGLLPFRLGGFAVAAEAALPVVPVAIAGTRSLLRAGSWLPRRGPVTVTVLPPVRPQGEGWGAAVALRDEVRAALLAATGEPDLVPEDAPWRE